MTSKPLESVTIKIAGDSGDGIQLIGTELSQTSAMVGNDIGTLPDFPAEIRAPIGTLAGVSGFQIQIGSDSIYTPGESYDALVALNPAALKVNLERVKSNGIVIINTNNFNDKGYKLAGYSAEELKKSDPLESDMLNSYQTYKVEITELTKKVIASDNSLKSMTPRSKEKCKNFFALGMLIWLYDRDLEKALTLLKEKFAKKPDLLLANTLAMKGGHAYCLATEAFQTSYAIPPSKFDAGKYRNISGNEGLALGMALTSLKNGIIPAYCSYPITPASDILHYMASMKKIGVITVQAEDEIAAVGMALGVAYGGSLGITGSSGPGISLKQEAISLAVMAELPMVVVNVQRAGPSTGMPTKTEQADLFQAIYGRHGEAPVVVIAPSTASNCFHYAQEAVRLAIKGMTPVYILSDGYIANGSEPWKIPDLDSFPKLKTPRTKATAKKATSEDNEFMPYLRNKETLAREWVAPGTPGYEHRVGGIEKQDITGTVSYDPDNHQLMSKLRRDKIEKLAESIPPLEVDDNGEKAEMLIVSWGSTYGAIKTLLENYRKQGVNVSHAHIHYLSPLPANLKKVLSEYKYIFVPEINFGQLNSVLKSKYGVETYSYNQMTGQPLKLKELKASVDKILNS